jgi:PAS domain S-box-containing protein
MEINLSNKEKRLIAHYTIGAIVFGLIMIGYVMIVALDSYQAANNNLPLIIDLHLQNPNILFSWAFAILLVYLANFITKRFILKRKKTDKIIEKQNDIINNNAMFAKSIGEGDFSTAIIDGLEKKDLLTRSLYKMRDNLIKNSIKEKNEIYINKGKELVSDILRKHDNFESLSYEVLKAILEYTDIIQGAIYVWKDKEEHFEQTATYAYNRKKYVNQTFKTGEGLIGAAAYEGLSIYRTEIPENFASITSGILGDKKPASLFIVPFKSEDKVHGLIEVASIQSEIEPTKRTLIEEVAPVIGQTFFRMKVNLETQKLLEESHLLTQELKENEEELQQNAEEMRMTHEELEKSNLELEKQIKEVEASQTKLNSLLENASEVISIYDKKGIIKYESPSTREIFGFEPEDVVNRSGLDRVAPGFEEIVQENFETLLNNPFKTVRYRFKHLKKNGEEIWVETTGRNMLKNNAISGIIFNTRDISLQKLAEKEKRVKGQMQALSENSHDIIIRFDKKAKFLYSNPSSQKFLNTEKLNNKLLKEVVIDENIKSFFSQQIESINKNTKLINIDFDLKKAKSYLNFQFNIIPEFNEEKEFESILFVGHNITDIRKIEREISDKNKKLTESINYAERIQKSIIPDSVALKNSFSDFAMINIARDVVSGDLPWHYENGDYKYIAAIDCTGHGVPGALLSFISHFLLNETVKDFPNYNPAQLLEEFDNRVKQSLKQNRNGSETRDGMDIGLCKINTKTNVLEYSGAHRPLLHQRNNDITTFKGDRRSIGGIYGKRYANKEFTNAKIDLKKGDRVFIFSDGLTDQFNEENQAKFQTKRVVEIVKKSRKTNLDNLESKLENSLKEWQGNYRQIDDILFIGIEI